MCSPALWGKNIEAPGDLTQTQKIHLPVLTFVPQIPSGLASDGKGTWRADSSYE